MRPYNWLPQTIRGFAGARISSFAVMCPYSSRALKLCKIIDSRIALCYNKYVYAVVYTSYYMIQTTKSEIENG